MFRPPVQGARRLGQRLLHTVACRLVAATVPSSARLVVDTLADLPRSKSDLIAENALLRQQLLVLRRSVKRVRCTSKDRTLLVVLASRVRAWRQALLIVQPETLLRWHHQGFRLFWRRKSQRTRPTARPQVSVETIALIKEMAGANQLWGAERIRGELLKLGIRVAKTTVQRHMRQTRPRRGSGQTWSCAGRLGHPALQSASGDATIGIGPVNVGRGSPSRGPSSVTLRSSLTGITW